MKINTLTTATIPNAHGYLKIEGGTIEKIVVIPVGGGSYIPTIEIGAGATVKEIDFNGTKTTKFVNNSGKDIIITNANIYDGTGKKPYCADIGIKDGKILEIGALKERFCSEVIDAKGLYVGPGFVDVHTHGRAGSDTMYPTFKDLNNISLAALKTGVTTVLPTTMTMPVEDIKKAVENIAE